MATATLAQPSLAHEQALSNDRTYPDNTIPKTTSPSATPSGTIPRGDVIAKLNFYSPPVDGSKPFNYVETPPEGQPQRNFGESTRDVTIHDLRGREHTATTDTHSFAALKDVKSDFRLDAFREDTPAADAEIKRHYYPEIEQLLLQNLSGSPQRILIFDHTIRRAQPNAPREPVQRVHIDQTAKAGHARVFHHVEDQAEAAKLAEGRVRIVNVWRPLGPQPVSSFPLAIADGSTVRDEDLVGVEHRYPDRTGETAGVNYNEGQQWWYLSGMTSEERLFLKCYDSDDLVGAVGRAPHTAFADPRTPEDAPPRESVEVRCLVFG